MVFSIYCPKCHNAPQVSDMQQLVRSSALPAYLVTNSYSTLKKKCCSREEVEVEEHRVEDSAREQKAVKYKGNMYIVGHRGKAIQITKNVCVCERKRERKGMCMCVASFKMFCCHLIPFTKPSCVVKQAALLSHELPNTYLFFFTMANASDSNYLANKDRIKNSPLRKRKLHPT